MLTLVLLLSSVQLGYSTAIGQTTADTGVAGSWSGWIYTTPFTAVSTATVTKVGINVGTAAGNIMVAIYSDSSGPSTLLGQSASTQSLSGWNDLPLVSTVSVSVGVTYWFALQASSATLAIHYAKPSTYYTSFAYAAFPNPFGTKTSTVWAPTFRDTIQTGPPPADYALSSSTSSQSVGAGGTAQYSLTLTPSSYAGAAVTLSLDGTHPCPSGANCIFAPSGAISLSGSTPVPATLSIATVIGGFTGTTSLLVDANNGTVTRTVTLSLTVSAPPNYGFNVKGTATQVVVTLMFSTSATPPAATFTLVEQNATKLMEPAGQVYDRTSIVVSSGAATYNVIHRVTWTFTATTTPQLWNVYVSLAGVSSYTVTIEVS